MLRDISVTILANANQDVIRQGDFIFLKSANKNLVVEIDQDQVEMQPGDALIFDNRVFFQFKVINNNAQSVTAVFTAGSGRLIRTLKAI
ncbi:MAG: hypothetical protein A3G34_15190 [Candidatus Lindowbacteria bacterium RIFCSPLOWO2_12_FULL_62_27]|nr:MAG: hypothetical protein A3G34_15190 [Candidatus Lindowbacteria bacterium RIFCSPLOWO2_12_FULL_62_27]OGH63869.1 MAG: hypothetical protein A3I06_06170 [Candidatus Lindowbacteria bacterium RIFCSPLOWO2_02_FULL_62_12]